MRASRREERSGRTMAGSRFAWMTFFLFGLASGTACGGSHTEYAPSSHPWIGKCAAFPLPMAYVTNLSADYMNREEILRIGRYLMRLDDAENDKKLPTGKELTIEHVPEGTTYEVVAVYTIVYEGLHRAFVEDSELVVLKDNHGLLSTTNLSGVKPCS